MEMKEPKQLMEKHRITTLTFRSTVVVALALLCSTHDKW